MGLFSSASNDNSPRRFPQTVKLSPGRCIEQVRWTCLHIRKVTNAHSCQSLQYFSLGWVGIISFKNKYSAHSLLPNNVLWERWKEHSEWGLNSYSHGKNLLVPSTCISPAPAPAPGLRGDRKTICPPTGPVHFPDVWERLVHLLTTRTRGKCSQRDWLSGCLLFAPATR